MSTFQRYNTKVRIENGSIGVTLPVDRLAIRAVPNVGGGTTAQKLFDGRTRFKPPTFGYRIELEWQNLGRHSDKLHEAVVFLVNVSNHTANAPVFKAHYDHTTGLFAPDKTIGPVVPEITDETVKTMFEQRSRKNRPGTLTLHSRFANHATPYSWLLES